MLGDIASLGDVGVLKVTYVYVDFLGALGTLDEIGVLRCRRCPWCRR